MKYTSLIASLSLATFSSLAFANDNYIIPAIPALDGDVSSAWEVDIFSDKLTIGNEGFFNQDHKAIITFDSSTIRKDKVIEKIFLTLNFSEIPEELGYSIDALRYIWDKVEIEIAGPAGFSGSYGITALDYYNAPIATLPSDDIIMWGMAYHVSLDITEYVNLYGLTQIAIRMTENPENYAVKFHSAEVPAQYDLDGGPKLFVIYE